MTTAAEQPENTQPEDTQPEDTQPEGASSEAAEPSTGEGFGESIAIPAGDLTGAIVRAMEPSGKDEDVPATVEVDGRDD